MRHENALAAVWAKKKTANSAVTPPDYSGLWQNEYSSIANFVVNGTSVSGIYTSVVSGGGAPVSGPIAGCISGDTIAFSVIWPTQQPSITSWVGQAVTDASGTLVLETLWYLVSDISEDPSQVWTSVYAGADVFTPAPINKP